MINFFTSAIIATLFSMNALGQQGTFKGQIFDEEGEMVPFANIYWENHIETRTTSDFDGNFTLKLDPGTYVIVFSFVSYSDHKAEITIESGETVTKKITFSSSPDVLQAVEVTAEAAKAKTTAAFDREKMNTGNMIDGTSSEQMQKTGDSDVGQVIKRVTGVSVVDGKHVYVRGLGDRYTKTILNGMEIPGLDPDKNSVQMDIFPTNLIDNIIVYKTFSPNLQGDFTGGMIDIQTKDFPSRKILIAKIGGSYNTQTTFNKNFFLYEGGKTDFLGIDDGSRALPIRSTDEFPDPTLGDSKLTDLTSAFGKTMATKNQNNFLNQNYAFGIGNQFNFDSLNLDYGINFFLNYRSNYNFYENAQFINDFQREGDSSTYDLKQWKSTKGTLAEQDVIWSAMLGQALKINNKHKISLTIFHTQNGNSKASRATETIFDGNDATLIKENLHYQQRSVTNIKLSGKHTLDSLRKWKMNWKISPTLSSIQDPDSRSTVFEELEGAYYFNVAVGAGIRRIFRSLNETNLSGKLDFEYSFMQWDSLESKLSFGILETAKKRNYEVLQYQFDLENMSEIPNDPNWFFEDENIWTPESDTGTYGIGAKELTNSYIGRQNVLGAYLMNELPLSKKLKTIYGLRMETVQNYYTGQNNQGSVIYTDSLVLNEMDFLPAVNFVYSMKKSQKTNMNLRGAYSKTIARPSFKEISIAQIYDPLLGTTYNGNINLKETNITNLDLRWESFFGRTEIISFSGFYKKFINPIEIVFLPNSPSNVQPINAGDSEIFGGEFELRKRIGFNDTTAKLQANKLTVGFNFTYVRSRVDMKQVMLQKGLDTITEFDYRTSVSREGETVSQYRTMSGQSPYIVNTFINYTQDSIGLDINLSYNVQGKRLSIIGIGNIPDVIEQPFHSLNFKASKELGKEKQWKISMRVQNILDSKKQRFFESYNTDSQVYDYYSRGRTFSASIGITL